MNHIPARFPFDWRSSTLVFLSLILAAGVFLRLYNIDYKSLWLDELYSIVPVNPANSVDFIIEHSKADQPPLYFILAHFWYKLTSYTPLLGRLLSAIFGLFGIVAIYFLGKEIKNSQTGLFASFLTAINYYHIYYSQELRFYSLLFLLTVVSFLFFIRSLKKKNLISYVIYTISTIALLYTHYFGILIFAIQGLIFVIYVILFRNKISFILTGVLLAILITISFTPWLPTLLYDSQIGSYWIPAPKPYFFAVYYYLYWGKDVFTAILLLVPGVLYLVRGYQSLKSETISKYEALVAIILLAWILLSYGVPYLRSIVSTPILQPRYTLVTLPAILIVIALGFHLIKSLIVRTSLIILVTASTLINLFLIQKHYTTHDKAQWREAAQAVIRNHEPNIKVYSNLEWWYNFYFYKTKPYIRVLGKYSSNEQEEKQELERLISEIENEEKFWVLNGEGASGLNALQQEYVDKYFNVEKRYDFFAASAVLYSRK